MMYYQQVTNITTVIEKDALEKARSDLFMGMALMDAMYPGEWRVEEDKLYKGETLINNNHQLVDKIGQLTNGDTVTIFLGNTRVATNVILEDGKRAIGTQVSDEVARKVLDENQIYLGQADVVGNTYQTAYMPIHDSDGEVIGIWYVGAPDADERIEQMKKRYDDQAFHWWRNHSCYSVCFVLYAGPSDDQTHPGFCTTDPGCR